MQESTSHSLGEVSRGAQDGPNMQGKFSNNSGWLIFAKKDYAMSSRFITDLDEAFIISRNLGLVVRAHAQPG